MLNASLLQKVPCIHKKSLQKIPYWKIKSGWVTKSKSLNVFEKRYHPQQSVVLSAWNIKTHGFRLYVPIYAAGRLGRLLLHDRKRLEQ